MPSPSENQDYQPPPMVESGAVTSTTSWNVPGYRLVRLLGRGAFGEVWIATDTNTNRNVAIKVFSHREGLNETLLSREVEKLVQFSADRFVVQLLKVGWDASPPFFVMEFIEGGSLEERIQRDGPLPVATALQIFREITIGLSHAHRKGILHCDLKPANILLDQDLHPRLADFGQSRLTQEQKPALGTLFYMAPEQAALDAIPDTRWDIYALGAIFYTMLVGTPPNRSTTAIEELDKARSLRHRLQKYQQFLKSGPVPNGHRSIPGVDAALAEIIDRCLVVDPEARYPHAEGVLEDLQRRDEERVRRPLWTLGILGPALLLLTMTIFGWRAYRVAVRESNEMVRRATQESNQFAADGVAKNAGYELSQRFRAVRDIAMSTDLQSRIRETLGDPINQEDFQVLKDPHADSDPVARAISRFRENSKRKELQSLIDAIVHDPRQPNDASWLVIGPDGTMLAAGFREPPSHPIVGESFAYRSYFHGGSKDLSEEERPEVMKGDVQLSAVFRSTATNQWKVAISTPIRVGNEVIGVLAMTVELGNIIHFQTSRDLAAMLVDAREGDFQGVVLQHPLFDDILGRQRNGESEKGIPARFLDYRVNVADYLAQENQLFSDPFAADELGEAYAGDWIAGVSKVSFPRLTMRDQLDIYHSDLLLIVQSRASTALAPVGQLSHRLVRDGITAILGFIFVAGSLWGYVWGRSRHISLSMHPPLPRSEPQPAPQSSLHDRETMVQRP
jgi:eukaryotic-like serine/threonine-protein kinase